MSAIGKINFWKSSRIARNKSSANNHGPVPVLRVAHASVVRLRLPAKAPATRWKIETSRIHRLMQLLVRADRGQLLEYILVLLAAISPEPLAGIAKRIAAELVAEAMRVAKVVETIAAAFASRQEMIYSALQVRMGGERQSTDPKLWINGFEYFLLGGNGQGPFISSDDVWSFRLLLFPPALLFFSLVPLFTS